MKHLPLLALLAVAGCPDTVLAEPNVSPSKPWQYGDIAPADQAIDLCGTPPPIPARIFVTEWHCACAGFTEERGCSWWWWKKDSPIPQADDDE